MNGQFLLLFQIVSSVISALAVIRGDSFEREPLNLVPIFNTTTINITGIAGETANLLCRVENKGTLQVIWMNPRKTLISTDDSRHIDDSRMSVERPKLNDWNLMIREVRSNDSGEYMCQINSDPVKIKRVYLSVLVAPEILDDQRITKYVVDEGSELSLPCIATGVPVPILSWYNQGVRLVLEGDTDEGAGLRLPNVSRFCDGEYECTADNGVKPVATKMFEVTVEFPPEVELKNKRMSQWIGKETILQCTVTASPHASIFWKKDGKDIPPHNFKYTYTLDDEDQKYQKTLSLHILNLEKKDFGYYTCYASNGKGRDSEKMLLYEYVEPTPPPSSTHIYVQKPKTLRIDNYFGSSTYTPREQPFRNGTEGKSKLDSWRLRLFFFFLFLLRTC